MAEIDGARCPVCGAIESVQPGQSVPLHQEPGSRQTCTGSGQTAQPR